MREKLVNLILMRGRRLRGLREGFAAAMRSRNPAGTLKDVLEIVALSGRLEPAYAAHAATLPGAIVFQPVAGGRGLALTVVEGLPEVTADAVPEPVATVLYRDERTLVEYLVGMQRQDADTVLRRDIVCEGNANGFRKLTYMIRRLGLVPPQEN